MIAAAAALAALLAGRAAAAEAPYTIERAVETALARNFRIRESREALERATGAVLEARARLLPRVDASGRYDQVDPGKLAAFNGRSFGSDRSWSASVELTQPLFKAGAGKAFIERERLRREAAALELAAVVNEVLLELRERFYAALLDEAKVRVREESLALLEAELESERRKRDAGVVSEFNVLRAEAAVANSRTPLIRARNELRLAYEELARVLGLEPAQVDAPALGVLGELDAPAEAPDLALALAQARARRPELKRLKTLVEAEARGVRVERADYFPALSAVAGYGAESSRFGGSLGTVDKGWTLGLRSDWALFESGAGGARARAARSRAASARIALERARAEIGVEVRRAHFQLLEAVELIAAAAKAVEAARESLRLARSRLDANVATQLDVLSAELALTEARTNAVQARHDYAVAAARREKAVAARLSE